MNDLSHKNNDMKTRRVLRIPDDKMHKPHNECTYMA